MDKQLSEGQIINDAYQILDCIGSGGAGVVYKAVQVDLDRVVALKMLRFELAYDQNSTARLRQEGRVLSELEHSAIVSCYAAGLFQGKVPFLVFEFLEGQSLRSLLNERKQLDILSVLSLGIQICQALVYAHAKLIIHRDLKPENIFLTELRPELKAKVLDFGLAKFLDSSAQKLTESGLLLGTVAYMSPEQCTGSSVDGRSDIYALACVLYECIAGCPVLAADTPIGVLYKQLNENPKRLREYLPEVPESLEAVLLKGMAKQPEDRYQTASEFQEDLEKLKQKLETDTDLSMSGLRASAAIFEAEPQKKSKQVSILTAAFGICLAILLLFLLSDPGPALFVEQGALFVKKSERPKYFESMGDSLQNSGRPKAAFELFKLATANCSAEDASTRLRLLSKQANAAFVSSGSDPEKCAQVCRSFFEELAITKNAKDIDIIALQQVLNVASKVPITLTQTYDHLWRLECELPIEEYEIRHGLRFALIMHDRYTANSDSQNLDILYQLLTGIMESERQNDLAGMKQLISWSAYHADKFGRFKRLLLDLFDASQADADKGSFMQAIVTVSCRRPGSPEADALLLVAARSYAYVKFDPEENFSAVKSFWGPQARTKTESGVVANVILADSCAARKDWQGFYDHLLAAAEVFRTLQDSTADPHRYGFFRDWTIRALVETVNRCPVHLPKRLRLLKVLRQCSLASARFRGDIDSLEEMIFAQYLDEKSYTEAESTLRSWLDSSKTKDFEYFLNWSRLAELCFRQKQFAKMKEVLIAADACIARENPELKVCYPVYDAWARYYQFGLNDMEATRRYWFKGTEGAKQSGKQSDLESHQYWLKLMDISIAKSKKTR